MRIFSFLIYALTTVVALSSCEEIKFVEKVDGFNVYRIQKGGHGSSSRICEFEKTVLNFDVRFDSTCIYDIGGDQSDINKLYGFNDCGNNNIHYNSARFGWRWMNDSLDLFSYVYVNGVGPLKNKIKHINIKQSYSCQIRIQDSLYIFSVDSKILDSVPRGCNDAGGIRYYSYPYFGGDVESPQEIVILLKDADYGCFE